MAAEMRTWTAPVPESFGDRLRRLRDERGLYAKDVAQRAGWSQQTISNLETGLQDPTVLCLEALADVLGTSMDYLWRGEQ